MTNLLKKKFKAIGYDIQFLNKNVCGKNLHKQDSYLPDQNLEVHFVFKTKERQCNLMHLLFIIETLLLPPFKKSRNALPQSTVTWSHGSFLRITSRRHLQETDEPNQAFLLLWNGGSRFFGLHHIDVKPRHSTGGGGY